MDCNKINKDMLFYAEGNLPDERREEIEAHLSECPECRGFLKVVVDSLGFIEREKQIGSNPFLYTRILSLLQNRKRESSITARKLVPNIIAATLLFIGIIGGIRLGKLYSGYLPDGKAVLNEEIHYLYEIKQETIESFFLTINDRENE